MLCGSAWMGIVLYDMSALSAAYLRWHKKRRRAKAESLRPSDRTATLSTCGCLQMMGARPKVHFQRALGATFARESVATIYILTKVCVFVNGAI